MPASCCSNRRRPVMIRHLFMFKKQSACCQCFSNREGSCNRSLAKNGRISLNHFSESLRGNSCSSYSHLAHTETGDNQINRENHTTFFFPSQARFLGSAYQFKICRVHECAQLGLIKIQPQIRPNYLIIKDLIPDYARIIHNKNTQIIRSTTTSINFMT